MNPFLKLFVKEKKEAETVPLTETRELTAITDEHQTYTLTAGVHLAYKTDIGLQRENNQDSLYLFESCIQSSDELEPIRLFMIADGMGGFEEGEIASATAIRVASEYIINQVYLPVLKADDPKSTEIAYLDVLQEAVTLANQEVLTLVPKGGTTLSISLMVGLKTYIAHVGDSRIYAYQNNTLTQITRDHSMAARSVDLGQASPEETATHPPKNVLYRAVGQASELKADTYIHTCTPQSFLLLCSDGLWGLVSNEKISKILISSQSLPQAVNTLINTANMLGGDDNISLILVGVGDER